MVYLVKEDLKALEYGTEIIDTEKLIVALYQLICCSKYNWEISSVYDGRSGVILLWNNLRITKTSMLQAFVTREVYYC